MRLAFSPASGTIIIAVELYGPLRTRVLRVLLDTGAMRTAIRPEHLEYVGYVGFTSSTAVPIVGATGVDFAKTERVFRLELEGVAREGLEVFAIDLASPAHIDGLLGMDFLAGTIVTINTVEGWVEIAPG